MKQLDLTYYDFLKNAATSGKFFYSILEGFPEGIIITDKQDKIIYVNLKIVQLTGYSRRELVGKTSHLFLHFPNQQNKLKNIAANRTAGIFETYELYIKRKKGDSFMGHTITAPYKDEKDTIIGTINIVTDITISKRQYELQAIAIGATKSSNSVMILNKYGKIEWVNEGFIKMSGYELYEVIDTWGEAFKGEKEGLIFLAKVREAMRKKTSVTYECRNSNKAGDKYWVISSITPTYDAQGNVKEVVVIDTDITERIKMEEELVMADKAAERSLKNENQLLGEVTQFKMQKEQNSVNDELLKRIKNELPTQLNKTLKRVNELLKTSLSGGQRKSVDEIKNSTDNSLLTIKDIFKPKIKK